MSTGLFKINLTYTPFELEEQNVFDSEKENLLGCCIADMLKSKPDLFQVSEIIPLKQDETVCSELILNKNGNKIGSFKYEELQDGIQYNIQNPCDLTEWTLDDFFK
jgi:hypothetical protein